MVDWLKSLLTRVKSKTIPSGKIEQAFSAVPAASHTMEQNISLWYSMYINQPPWSTCDVRSLGLPGAIGRELSRHAMTEFSVVVSGSKRGDYINSVIEKASKTFKEGLEIGLCLGGVALRPYWDGSKILVDTTSATAFSPIKFDGDGRAVSGVFREVARKGREFFVRMEYHGFERTYDGTSVYVIRNKAFKGDVSGNAGAEVSLSSIPEWENLEPEIFIENLEKPLFSYFKPPIKNDIDPNSSVGVSVYSGATVDLIQQADEQWERIWWEYKSGERKIFSDGASVSAGQFMHRLFEYGSFTSDGNLFQPFSPEIRDEPLYRGFQHILQRIEFNVGLAYGTISDPQAVEKTATEIIAAKQRQYATEGDIQRAFQSTIDDLIYAIDVYCGLYNLAPSGEYEVDYSWGDGVLDDPETRMKNMQIDLQKVSAGIMDAWEFRVKWDGEDEETAKSRVPEMERLVSAAL